MPTVRCLICKNDALKVFVDTSLDRGVSNRGIAAAMEAAGGKIDPEVIGRHKNNHWTPPKDPDAHEPTKRDLAIQLRDRVARNLERVPDYEPGRWEGEGEEKIWVPGTAGILDKDLAPAIAAGLKAQTLLDKRASEKSKLGLAAGAIGLQMYLAGLGRETDPPELEDGNTIEGEAIEVA